MNNNQNKETTAILCDSHTHFDQYDASEIPQILNRAVQSGVNIIIAAGTTIESTKACIGLAGTYPTIFAGVGIHPMESHQLLDSDTSEELHKLAKSHPEVVCISEVGLDFLPSSPDHKIQEQVFREHIRIAIDLNLPIIFHSRESHDDVLRILNEEGAYRVGGAMHYFQGDLRTAKLAIDSGFKISLARPLTRLPELQEVVKHIAIDDIVLETDCFPQPFKKYRHNWTEPRHLVDIAQTLSELKRIDLSEAASITTKNLTSLLKLNNTDETEEND